VKGFEIGSGFAAATMKASEHNDEFFKNKSGKIRTKTNYGRWYSGRDFKWRRYRGTCGGEASLFHSQAPGNGRYTWQQADDKS